VPAITAKCTSLKHTDLNNNMQPQCCSRRPQDVDDVFRKYDPKGTGKLDVHSFVTRLVSPATNNVNWFRDKDTYEFHVLNRAPMKKVSVAGKGEGVYIVRRSEPSFGASLLAGGDLVFQELG